MSKSVVELKEKILTEIEKEMARREMSQGELGRKIGVERYNINRYFRNRNAPLGFERLLEMAEAVDLDIDVTVKRRKQKK